ncbi:hypothetical protein TWF696_003916 [Orbilia brochopaga]|uniref:Uncharacterized protein n=1 Tax=Orbilia brochopaga TaxID=3140254 RepID=A0AAV9V5F2_9PEZI
MDSTKDKNVNFNVLGIPTDPGPQSSTLSTLGVRTDPGHEPSVPSVPGPPAVIPETAPINLGSTANTDGQPFGLPLGKTPDEALEAPLPRSFIRMGWVDMKVWPPHLASILKKLHLNAQPYAYFKDGPAIYLCRLDKHWALLADGWRYALIKFPGLKLEELGEAFDKVRLSGENDEIIFQVEWKCGGETVYGGLHPDIEEAREVYQKEIDRWTKDLPRR